MAAFATQAAVSSSSTTSPTVASSGYSVRGQHVGRDVYGKWTPVDGAAIWIDGLVLHGTTSVRFEVRPLLRGEHGLMYGVQDGEAAIAWTLVQIATDVEELMISGRQSIKALLDAYRSDPARAAELARLTWSMTKAESMPAMGGVRR